MDTDCSSVEGELQRFFFSFEVDCSKTFLTRPKLAQYVKRRSALSSVDDLFIGISKSGNHAFVFFANPFASLTAFSACKSQFYDVFT